MTASSHSAQRLLQGTADRVVRDIDVTYAKRMRNRDPVFRVCPGGMCSGCGCDFRFFGRRGHRQHTRTSGDCELHQQLAAACGRMHQYRFAMTNRMAVAQKVLRGQSLQQQRSCCFKFDIVAQGNQLIRRGTNSALENGLSAKATRSPHTNPDEAVALTTSPAAS